MATKKLETEFLNLKKEFVGLQTMIQSILDKHGDLERKYEKLIQKQKKYNFRCRKCTDKFESLISELKKHKEEGCSKDEIKCEECEKFQR